MPDLHPSILALIEAGPQRINRADSSYVDANYVKETPEEFARRCVALAVEFEKERCAMVCDELASYRELDGAKYAAAIRRRGKP